MNFLHKILPVITIWLVLIIGIIPIVPTDLHFRFCFGNDGHFDFLLKNSFSDSLIDSIPQNIALSDQFHHTSCLDLPFFFASPFGLFRLNKSDNTKTIQKTPFIQMNSFLSSKIANNQHFSCPNIFHPFLSKNSLLSQTTVLLL
jgi:hypothetical protein